MTDTRAMLEASPEPIPLDLGELTAAIDACFNCVQTCTACADSDLLEPDVDQMRACIALCLTCADLCDTTARVLSRPGQWDRQLVGPLLEACVRACATCGDECARHADHHRHCAICAEACQACVESCQVVLASVQRSG